MKSSTSTLKSRNEDKTMEHYKTKTNNKKEIIEEILTKSIKEINTSYVKYIKKSIILSNEINNVEMKCKVADIIFWSIYSKQQKEEKHKLSNNNDNDKDITIDIISKYGLQQTYTRRQLAETIIFYISQEDRNKFSYISLAPVLIMDNNKKKKKNRNTNNSGMIYMCTKEYTQVRYNKYNLLLCELCGKYVNKENGLFWHLKNVHDVTKHQDAYDSYMRSSNAIISYNKNNSNDTLFIQRELEEHTKKQKIMNNVELEHEHQSLSPFEACRNGDIVKLKRYIENDKWDPNMNYDKNGCSVLLWAAGCGHLDICKYLIIDCNIILNTNTVAQRSSSKRSKGYNQRTALHWCCRNGHIHVVKWLIEHTDFFKNNVDIVSSDGTTSLCLAAWQCHIDVCMYLINDAGASPHTINTYGCNIAMWLSQSTTTSKEDDIIKLSTFLYNDCNVNFTSLNSNGQGCLHKAAQRGNTTLCKWLIETTIIASSKHDDDKNKLFFLPNEFEKSTPSQLAKYEGYNDLSNYLLSIENKYK